MTTSFTQVLLAQITAEFARRGVDQSEIFEALLNVWVTGHRLACGDEATLMRIGEIEKMILADQGAPPIKPN